jgi:hypothetical protein
MDNTNEEEKKDGMEGGENNNENKDMPSEGSNDAASSTEEGE